MKKLLLHICCAPDGAYAANLLKDSYEISFYFFNPNINEEAEYKKREQDAKTVAERFGVRFIESRYPVAEWLLAIRGYEQEAEGKGRCLICYEYRLREAALQAKLNGCDLFTTVLTVSPHKHSRTIFEIGNRIAAETGVEFLSIDFKKKDGFKKSIGLSKELGLYRQNYCGCTFSKR
jgi:predicted adenine nucleotide alpha hydrolase (AANH) superfamily ATPase